MPRGQTAVEKLVQMGVLGNGTQCPRCNARNSFVPSTEPEFYICMQPSVVSLPTETDDTVIQCATITCGHQIHTRHKALLCPKCSDVLQIRRPFHKLGFACLKCERFESKDDVERRLAKTGAKEAKKRAKSKRHGVQVTH